MASITDVGAAIRGSLTDLPNSIGLVASAVFTGTGSVEFGCVERCKVVEVVVVQTAGTAGQSVTVGIDGFNPADGTWENLITSAAITSATTATTVVQVNPYTPPITNSSAQRQVRRRMRVTMTHADGKSITYSINVHAGS